VGVLIVAPPLTNRRESVFNPFRDSQLGQKIEHHQNDIADIRRVNKNRHRAFRQRFEKIERKLDGAYADIAQLRVEQTIGRAGFTQKLLWQHNALQDQIDALRDCIEGLVQVQEQSTKNSVMTTMLLESHADELEAADDKLEVLRKSLNATSEAVLRFIKKHGDDADQDAVVGFVGSTEFDDMGLNDVVRTSIGHYEDAHGNNITDDMLADQDFDPETPSTRAIPEELQAFIDMIKENVPPDFEVEVLGPTRVSHENFDGDDDGEEEEGVEYEDQPVYGIRNDGTQVHMRVQTEESFRRNGPRNAGDAMVNSLRAERREQIARDILSTAKLID
jgi:hypothetical protein